jgi:hypothetical protein
MIGKTNCLPGCTDKCDFEFLWHGIHQHLLNFENQKITMELVHEIADLSVNILCISVKKWQGFLLNSYFGRTNGAPITILVFTQ